MKKTKRFLPQENEEPSPAFAHNEAAASWAWAQAQGTHLLLDQAAKAGSWAWEEYFEMKKRKIKDKKIKSYQIN